MKKTSALWSVVTAGVVMSGVALAAGREITLGKPDHGKTVTTTDVAVVKVRLPGNPTTGFQWEIAGVDGGALKQEGKVEYEPGAHGAARVGVGGTFTATFRVAARGRSVVRMVYRRSWEKDVPPVEEFRVTVDVREAPSPSPPTQPSR